MKQETTLKAIFGLPGILGLILIILKLCKVIAWPWGVVLIPIWLPLFIFALATVAFVAICLLKPGKTFDDIEE